MSTSRSIGSTFFVTTDLLGFQSGAILHYVLQQKWELGRFWEPIKPFYLSIGECHESQFLVHYYYYMVYSTTYILTTKKAAATLLSFSGKEHHFLACSPFAASSYF